MTDEQWAEIKPYAEAAAKARTALHAHAMMNMPTKPRAALEARVAYERAYEEWRRASVALDHTKERILGPI